jgi:hypothetical protein
MLGPWIRGSGAGAGVSVAGSSRPDDEGPHHAQLAAASKKNTNRGRMSWLLFGVGVTLFIDKVHANV